jgi:hypothetical protein
MSDMGRDYRARGCTIGFAILLVQPDASNARGAIGPMHPKALLEACTDLVRLVVKLDHPTVAAVGLAQVCIPCARLSGLRLNIALKRAPPPFCINKFAIKFN